MDQYGPSNKKNLKTSYSHYSKSEISKKFLYSIKTETVTKRIYKKNQFFLLCSSKTKFWFTFNKIFFFFFFCILPKTEILAQSVKKFFFFFIFTKIEISKKLLYLPKTEVSINSALCMYREKNNKKYYL